MNLNNDRFGGLLDRLKKSISYLEEKVDRDGEYQNLIDRLNGVKQQLNDNQKTTISIINPGINLGLNFQAKIEANTELRSLYSIEVINPLKDALEVVTNSGLICLIYNYRQNILPSHQKIITFAREQNKTVIILVKQHNSKKKFINLSNWLESQKCDRPDDVLLLLDRFINLENEQQIELVQQFLLEQQNEIRSSYIRHKSLEVDREIADFFQEIKTQNWRKIKQIQDEQLEGKAIYQYQQHIKQEFNTVIQQFRQRIIPIKQSINNSRSDYLNPFLPDSWLFELYQLIEAASVKILTESAVNYLYLVINSNNNTEYLHSYILGWYQQKAIEALEFQQSKINYNYGDAGLAGTVEFANQKLTAMPLLDRLPQELNRVKFDSQPLPEFKLTEIIDFDCLKTNSRIVFDYKYTQGSWFKLLILSLIITMVYLVSYLYFQKGFYIGFIILVFQLVNILTGQDLKKIKLKQHEKELRRTINQKYQTLVRLIIEQSIKVTVFNLDRQEKQYLEQIKAIASLAELEIDKIADELDRYKAKRERLKENEERILS